MSHVSLNILKIWFIGNGRYWIMEEDEYNDIVTYIQDQKYPQNANESVKRKLRNKVNLIKKYFTSIMYIFIWSNVNWLIEKISNL